MDDRNWRRITRWRAPLLLTPLLCGLKASWSVRVTGEEHAGLAGGGTGDGRRIFAFWHGQMLPLVGGIDRVRQSERLAMLRADTGQTRFASAVVEPFGIEFVQGADGSSALLSAARAVQGGASMAIAVDGPAGPAGRARSGASVLSRMTGVPVVPVVCTASRGTNLHKFWDRALIPWPFTTVSICLGAPLNPPAGHGDVKEHVQLLQAALEACFLSAGA
jgi:lysophospholipid acyltransferase (LPLAT)-like uncharacterized protein